MVFASLIFVFGFLPLFLVGYYAVPSRTWRNAFLTLASYAFYAWWRADFVILMLVSTIVDYACARRMEVHRETPRARKAWLLVSLCTNLGLLAYFKYANLVVDTVESMWAGSIEWQDVVLPVGISFYTFQSMSYSIDVYRGDAKVSRSFIDFACYVSMFPQLVAGPIVRYRTIAEELVTRTHSFAKFSAGVLAFEVGLAKKVLLADNVALLADPVFAMSAPGLLDAWTGVFAYALQIYFDFSGYSDMAIGLGLMLGFHLPRNFFSPYRATSITDFWRRWHISLSAWLRDYLYVPLGGNRRGPKRTYVNLAATMLLGGLWHGAAWTFVLWGAYQGAFLVLERLVGKRALYEGLPYPVRVVATFVIVLGGWAIFRAEGSTGLASIFGGLVGVHGIGGLSEPMRFAPEAWFALAAGSLVAFFGIRTGMLVHTARPWFIWWALGVAALSVGQLASRDFSPFIYFQF